LALRKKAQYVVVTLLLKISSNEYNSWDWSSVELKSCNHWNKHTDMQTDTQVTAPQKAGCRINGRTQSEHSFCAMIPTSDLDNWETSTKPRELSNNQYQGLVEVLEPLHCKLLTSTS
jgi:Tfp pilus assembly major pilin PilA